MKYVQAYSGDLLPLASPERVACCDCGLVHDYRYVLRKGKPYKIAHRNNRASAQYRRHRRKKLRAKLRKVGLL